MTDPIRTKVKDILAIHTKIAAENLYDVLSLQNTEIDSLGMMEVIFDLKDEFQIDVPEPETIEEHESQFSVVGNIVNLVETLVKQKN